MAFLTLADLEVWRLRTSLCFHKCAAMEGLNKSSKPVQQYIVVDYHKKLFQLVPQNSEALTMEVNGVCL